VKGDQTKQAHTATEIYASHCGKLKNIKVLINKNKQFNITSVGSFTIYGYNFTLQFSQFATAVGKESGSGCKFFINPKRLSRTEIF
jgi:hypothetical protein